MGYGDISDAYMSKIREALQKTGCSYTISMKFMDEKEIAELRMSMDIYINGCTTDALSASMLEYLYAGCLVMNPKWIKYEFLKEQKIKYIEYNSFNALSLKLENRLNKKSIGLSKDDKNYNHEIIKRSFLWKNIIKKWDQLYEL